MYFILDLINEFTKPAFQVIGETVSLFQKFLTRCAAFLRVQKQTDCCTCSNSC